MKQVQKIEISHHKSTNESTTKVMASVWFDKDDIVHIAANTFTEKFNKNPASFYVGIMQSAINYLNMLEDE